jgi:hypothetical protein
MNMAVIVLTVCCDKSKMGVFARQLTSHVSSVPGKIDAIFHVRTSGTWFRSILLDISAPTENYFGEGRFVLR